MDCFNYILAALSKGLDSLFPDIPVFAEEIPQELPERCFLTGFAGEVEAIRDLGERYRIEGSLDITYLAPQNGPETEIRRELNRIAGKIALELGVIRYQDTVLRLRKHKYRTDGSELHNICEFSTFLFHLDQTPVMDQIKVGEKRVKNERG